MRPVRLAAVLLAAVLLLGYGWWATALPPFTGTSTAAVVGAGLGAMAVGLRFNRRREVARPPAADIATWALLAGALAVWQLAAYLQHPRSQHPTLSSLANAALDSHPVRALAFVAWILGAAFLARR